LFAYVTGRAAQARQRPRNSSVMCWTANFAFLAHAPRRATASGSSNSVTVPQSLQMAKTAVPSWLGCRQATKALSESSRWARPSAISRSSER
jgi:hypothetical protein